MINCITGNWNVMAVQQKHSKNKYAFILCGGCCFLTAAIRYSLSNQLIFVRLAKNTVNFYWIWR